MSRSAAQKVRVKAKSHTFPNLQTRCSGVLLHPTSLPSEFAVGDIGTSAHAFMENLASAKQAWWQMLPINPIGCGNSPYMTVCTFAGEPLLLDLKWFADHKLIRNQELPRCKDVKKVNFKKARSAHEKVWKTAYARFKAHAEFYDFCETNKHWLDDYALYCALASHYSELRWHCWPADLAQRKKSALLAARKAFNTEVNYHFFLQFCFDQQWAALRAKARAHNIGLIGDLPIFVAHESSDVWAHQENFCLNADGSLKFVAGVPPDYFNRDGQLWGNAQYNWRNLEKNGFKWWIDRFKHLTARFDIVRIDHFIGFHRYWEIKAGAKNARKGTWRFTPGDALLTATQEHLGGLPFIAEDLGLMVPEVTALREKFALPGMKVLQFGFGTDSEADGHLPFSFTPNHVVYPGTHDNNTVRGWFDDAKKERSQPSPLYDYQRIASYFHLSKQSYPFNRAFIEEAMKSVANHCIIALQDVLGLDGRSRMNTPGTLGDNWSWRMPVKSIPQETIRWLKSVTELTGRSHADNGK